MCFCLWVGVWVGPFFVVVGRLVGGGLGWWCV